MFKNLPSNARDIGSIAGRIKIPYAIGQLSLCTATTGPMHSGACAPQLERSPHATTVESMGSGAPVPQLERSPHAKTETPSTAAETQRSQKQVNAQSA